MASIDTVINQTMINQTMLNQTMVNQTMINQTLLNQYNVYATVVQQINNKTEQTTSVMQQAGAATDKLNCELNKTGTKASSASVGLGKILNVTKMVTKAAKGMKIADQYTNIMGRIGLVEDVNKGLQTQAQLQDKIFAASNRARGSYLDMADTVVDLELLAGDAFGSSDETIAFAELAQKSFKLGGTDPSAQKSAMDKLTQSMASGQLKGGDFDSIMGNAPMLYDAIAKYTGLSKGELKKLAADSGIAADVIKNSLFMASNNINDEFAGMPVTFADIWERIKNGAFHALGPVIEKINALIDSQGFTDVINTITTSLNILSFAIGGLIDFVIGNWPMIQVILLAVGTFLLYQLIGYLTAALPVLMAHVALWWSLNAPIVAVIAVIALIIYNIISMGVTFEDIFGYIGGVVAVAIATIWNLFVGLFELLLGILNFIVNPFINFANFLGNIFTNPISSIVYLFQGMADSVLGIIEAIANAIDAVFGSSLGDTVSGWRTDLKKMADDYVAKHAPDENYQKLIDNQNWTAESFGIERMAYGEAWDNGQSVGKEVYSALSEKIGGLMGQFTPKDDKGTEFNPTVIKGPGSGGKVEVDMAKEDLKYLRDIAEREYINKFSTATLAPNVQISFGDVHETADIDRLKGTLERMMREEIAVAAEGVF